MALFSVRPNPRRWPVAIQAAISLHRIIQSTSCLVLGFLGLGDQTALLSGRRNPKLRPAAILKIFKWHICAMHHLIHFMYVWQLYFAVGHYTQLYSLN